MAAEGDVDVRLFLLGVVGVVGLERGGIELEIKFTRKGDGGSNPSLSANKLTARISPPNIYPQICKLFPGQNFPAIWSSKTLRLRRQAASINCWASAFALEQTVKRGDFRLEPGRNTPMTLPQDLCYAA